jgi:hypothetical protein
VAVHRTRPLPSTAATSFAHRVGLNQQQLRADLKGQYDFIIFFLSFFTWMAVTRGMSQQIRSGRLTPLGIASARPSLIDRVPAVRWRRAVAFGAISTALLSPIAIPILIGVNFAGVSGPTFVLYKVVLGVSLGLVVTTVRNRRRSIGERSATMSSSSMAPESSSMVG